MGTQVATRLAGRSLDKGVLLVVTKPMRELSCRLLTLTLARWVVLMRMIISTCLPNLHNTNNTIELLAQACPHILS